LRAPFWITVGTAFRVPHLQIALDVLSCPTLISRKLHPRDVTVVHGEGSLSSNKQQVHSIAVKQWHELGPRSSASD